VTAGFTVSVALLLVAEPAELLTDALNVSPEFAAVVAAVVYDAEVAPLIAVPFMLHW
jgi:hypothetical protein